MDTTDEEEIRAWAEEYAQKERLGAEQDKKVTQCGNPWTGTQ